MKLKPTKLCKATFTRDDGSQQACTGKPTGPEPAIYGLRGGGLYCNTCWVHVEEHFLNLHPGHPEIAARALRQITRQVK